ncbi:MAG TPA: DUF72 domain-containing protein [Candidatus Angelobacter sp.]|nr:DUF72 domain-containing protein [Candidatus Angelobacter sp.]
MKAKLYIGTAGWNVPGIHAQNFASEGTHLARYAQKLNSAEINSCFYREHKTETYLKWAASVPEDFSFAVKAPRAITHEGELRVDGEEALKHFLQQTSALGEKRGPVLLQVPPSLKFHKARALEFFLMLRKLYDGPAVLEPRHVSWFGIEPDLLLRRFSIARVAADPALTAEAAEPAGWAELIYFRLHGSPRRYYSCYSKQFLADLAEKLLRLSSRAVVWCIFDNTASGAALGNALELISHIYKEKLNADGRLLGAKLITSVCPPNPNPRRVLQPSQPRKKLQ